MTSLSTELRAALRHNLVLAFDRWAGAEGRQLAKTAMVDASDDVMPPIMGLTRSSGDLADTVLDHLEQGWRGDLLWKDLQLSTSGGETVDSRARFGSLLDTIRSAQLLAEPELGRAGQ